MKLKVENRIILFKEIFYDGYFNDTRLKELEAENARLKRMYADERLKADILQDALSKKL